MQDTRLSRILNGSIGQLGGWLQNPWRRISLVGLGLLFGNFLATAISTVSGQRAESDVIASIVVVGLTEAVSWYVYRRSQRTNFQRTNLTSSDRGRPPFVPEPFVPELLNALKIGLTYGLFMEAFKLGS
jgi:Protein of unknown function (DUF565)